MQEFIQKNISAVTQAKKDIEAGKICIAVIRNEETIYTAQGRGVKPLLDIVNTQKDLLTDSIVVDKIVGRAAALLMIPGGVKEVYALTMSRSAEAELEKAGIVHHADELAEKIINRTGDDICPMEKAVQDIVNPQDAPYVLTETLNRLMSESGK